MHDVIREPALHADAETSLGPWLSAALVLLAIAMPVVVLLRNSTSSVVFYALVALSLVALVSPAGRASLVKEVRVWLPLIVGGGVFLAAIVLAQLGHAEWSGTGIEKTVRFVLLVPLLLAFRLIPRRTLLHMQWGILLAATVMGLLLMFPPVTFGTRPDTAQFVHYNTVEFGSLTCLLAMLSFLSCGWQATRFTRAEIILKLAVGAFALYCFLLSETRTGWLAMPVFLLIALGLLPHTSRRVKAGVAVAIVFFGLLTLYSAEGLQIRIRIGLEELVQCRDEPLTDSSVCIRFQLASAARGLFSESPIFGVGEGGAFRAALNEQRLAGVVSPYVAENFGEPHNDYLFYIAAYGLLGLIGGLAFVYALPAWYFIRAFRADLSRTSIYAAAMGLALCGAFASFGLTEMMFRSMRTASFFAVWLALFLALAAPPRLR